MTLLSGEILELSIGDLSRWGSGVGRSPDGRAIFVPFTAPGDRVRARIRKSDKRFAEADLIEILEPSKIRVKPPCLIFGRCGGCQWQHLPYELQWTAKVAGVKQALQRVSVAVLGELDEIPAAQTYGYRNRIQARGQQGKLGFFAEKSHELIPTDRCPISDERINAEWEAIRSALPKDDELHKVEIEVLESGKVSHLLDAPHAALGFRQIHDDQNERLRAWVDSALPGSWEVMDLYGGSGNLSLRLAERMIRVDCVDTSSPVARPEGTPANLVFHRSPVGTWLAKRAGRPSPSGARAERAAILDPPREGLGRDAQNIVAALRKLDVTRLIAIGCDPDAWARDVARFVEDGWDCERGAVLDFFPQTTHIESVMLLSR